MEDLLKKKMEIAKRAGELHVQINGLSDLVERIQKNKTKGYDSKKGGNCPETLFVKISGDCINTNGIELNSYAIDPGGVELHDALLTFLNSQICKRTIELNDLIKVLA